MNKNALSVCRCCLAEKKSMKDMADTMLMAQSQQETLLSCYSICSGIDLSASHPDLSISICKPCERKLTNAYEFRELCQESNRVLMERCGMLVDVKKEDVSDEEAKHDATQVFNQVFLQVHPEVAPIVPEEVIKIEDDPPEEEVVEYKPEAKIEVPKDDDASPSPVPNDNWNDSHEPEENANNSSEEDEPPGQTEEEKASIDNEIDEMSGKILCFRCDLFLNSIREYKLHRLSCTGSRYRHFCAICNEPVQRFTRHLEEKHRDYKPFECGACDGKYATLNNLRLHLYCHTNRKIFQCMASWCGAKFHTPKELRYHVAYTNKHKINHYHCHVCGKNFPKFLELVEHCERYRNDESVNFLNLPFVPCFHCKKLFVQRKNFLTHKCKSVDMILKQWRTKKGSKTMLAKFQSALATRWTKVITDSTPQTCDRCQKVFTNDDEFACHRYSECVEEPKFICANCGKEFANMQALKSHGDTHLENRRFICESCGVSFAVKISLAKHMLTHTIGRTFKCPLCPASFVDNNGLKTHSTTHNERKYECDICGRRFRTYDQIKQHMPVHSMELRKFCCEICNKRFARKCEFRKHHRHFHSGLKPLNCAFCKRTFRDAVILKRHHRDMHSQITYECPHCQKVLQSRTGLTEHLFLHRGFHPFNCPACPRKFIKQTMFSKHLMKGHNIKYDEKTHGYRETELNMRQILADAERHPNRRPTNEAQEEMDYQVSDMDVKNTPEPAVAGCYAGVANFPSGYQQ